MQYIVAGLGNPGVEYAHTRHNVGRMVVETLAERVHAADWRLEKKARARVTHGMVDAHEVLFITPEQYMNRSGASLAPFVEAPEQVIVVHDDIDLPLGTIRIAFGRGSGGHNGVSSVETLLQSRSFVRVRVGVLPVDTDGLPRKPKGEDAVLTFLLKKMSISDREALEPVIIRAGDAVLAVICNGKEEAMQTFN
jgi:peptidyl-tRNA hydrolase, PTH1 family